jgi:predicted ribosomally synthesized peptide with SipW-like signal peptide
MNRKIAISSMSILGALVIMGGATFAAFSDSVTATGNTFAVGDANLEIALDSTGPFNSTIEAPDFSGMFPGQTKEYTFWLRNNSTAAIDLDLVADVTSISDPVDANAEIDNVLLVSWVCDTDGNGGLVDNTPTSEFSPRAWLDGGNTSIGSLGAGEQMVCRMFGRLPSSAGNDIAGETVSFSVEYGATQVFPTPTPE